MRREKTRGSVLIIALWSVMILGVMAVSLGAGVRQRLVLADRLVSTDRLQVIAFSGVEAARSLIRRPDATENFDAVTDDWAKGDRLKDQRLAGGSFTAVRTDRLADGKTAEGFGLEDEDRKINLNLAKTDTMSRLLQKAGGLEEDKAVELAYCIADWRDADSDHQHPDYGAEDADYGALKPPYEAKDAPFESLDELLLIKGMNRGLFDKIRPFVTIYGPGRVNLNTAPEEVLDALGLSKEFVARVLEYRAGPDRTPGTQDDRVFTEPLAVVKNMADAGMTTDVRDEAVLDQLGSADAIGATSKFFFVRSRAKLDSNGATLDAEAVMDRKGKVYFYRTTEMKRR